MPHSLKQGVGVETGVKADGTPSYQTVEKNFIPEGDLYRLIIRSKLPKAVEFEKWVFDEVLPTIRKTGDYIPNEGDTESEIMAKALFIGQRIIEEQKQRITQLETQTTELIAENNTQKQINTELTAENQNQTQINLILTKQVQEWERKNIVRKLMNVYANRRCKDNYARAYNTLYNELRYKKGICLSQRVPRNSKKSLLSAVRENEWNDVVQVALAICVNAGLNIRAILNSTNAEKVPI